MANSETRAYGPASDATLPAALDDRLDLRGRLVSDRYRVISKLGEGGMGVVYLVEHAAIEKRFAMKVLAEELARRPDVKERFLQEARAAARIGHPNIVDITDFGATPGGSVFFTMELLEGPDLAEVIRLGGAMPWSRARQLLLQICAALGAAHAKGIVHRDVKPANIVLVPRPTGEQIKVLDFGIAKVTTLEARSERLTRTGMIFGTPEYMAPEQALGRPVDGRADLYAVGVIMYEMLTGRVPFKADSFMAVLNKHIHEPPPPPSTVDPLLPIGPALEAIVLRALAKAPEDRFQSMAELAGAIEAAERGDERPAALADDDAGATLETRRMGGRGRWLAATAALVALGAGVGLALQLRARPPAARPAETPAPPRERPRQPGPAAVTAGAVAGEPAPAPAPTPGPTVTEPPGPPARTTLARPGPAATKKASGRRGGPRPAREPAPAAAATPSAPAPVTAPTTPAPTPSTPPKPEPRPRAEPSGELKPFD